MLCALSAPTIQLNSTIPTLKPEITFDVTNQGLLYEVSQNIAYNENISQMNEKNQPVEKINLSWNEVLDRLINIVIDPVNKAIIGHKYNTMSGLTRHCSHLLARIVAEMVHQYKGDVSRN